MQRKRSMTLIAITISATAAFGSAAKDTSKAATGIVVEPAKSAAPGAATTAPATPAAAVAPATKPAAPATAAAAAPAAKPAAAPASQAAAPAAAAPAQTAAAAPAKAGSGTPCEEVKAKLSEKLSAKGVKTFTLDAVPQGQETKEGKVIGSCEGGAKKIVYKRG